MELEYWSPLEAGMVSDTAQRQFMAQLSLQFMLGSWGCALLLPARSEVPGSLQERQRMSDRLEDTSLRLKDEMDLYKRMMDKLRQNRLEFNKEREATQEVSEGGCETRQSHTTRMETLWERMGRQGEHWKHRIQWSCCWAVFLWEGSPQSSECCRNT